MSDKTPHKPFNDDEIKKTIRRLGIVLTVAVVLIIALVIGKSFLLKWAEGVDKERGVTVQAGLVEGVEGLKLGGDFTLTRHDGQTVTYGDIKGTPHVLFFGFTYCPDICPTELGAISNALDAIGPEKLGDLRVLFVSIDPERDTPEQLARYVVMFHERIEGLTGTPEQIDAVKSLYKVYAQKVESPELSDYTMDHSAFIYLFDAQGDLKAMYRNKTPMAEIKAGIESMLVTPSAPVTP